MAPLAPMPTSKTAEAAQAVLQAMAAAVAVQEAMADPNLAVQANRSYRHYVLQPAADALVGASAAAACL